MTFAHPQKPIDAPGAASLDLIETLWDSLEESGEALLDVPQAHQVEPLRRWTEYQRRPNDVAPREEVKAKLLKPA
jgi:putative addiction module component (TIGR02574 family)